MSLLTRIDLKPRITERGLGALAAARMGAPLYVYRGSRWVLAPRGELARAERLALRNPQALTRYGAEAPRRR